MGGSAHIVTRQVHGGGAQLSYSDQAGAWGGSAHTVTRQVHGGAQLIQ